MVSTMARKNAKAEAEKVKPAQDETPQAEKAETEAVAPAQSPESKALDVRIKEINESDVSLEKKMELISKATKEYIASLRKDVRVERKADAEKAQTELAAEALRNFVQSFESKTGRTIMYASLRFARNESGPSEPKITVRSRKATEAELNARWNAAKAEAEKNASAVDAALQDADTELGETPTSREE